MALHTSLNVLAHPSYIYPDGTNVEVKVNDGGIVSFLNGGDDANFSAKTNITTLLAGRTSYKVDWGDGTRDTYTTITSNSNAPTHTYAQKGVYRISISDDLQSSHKGVRFQNLTEFHILSIARSLTNCRYMFKITSWDSLSHNHTLGELTRGTFPKLPEGLIDGSQMFSTCRGMTGSLPSLPSTLIYATWMFQHCCRATGRVPRFNNIISHGDCMFLNCPRLTGDIPQMPPSLINCNRMFELDTGLTGTESDNPSDYMPVSAVNHSDYVKDCSESLRAKFTLSWGGMMPNPVSSASPVKLTSSPSDEGAEDEDTEETNGEELTSAQSMDGDIDEVGEVQAYLVEPTMTTEQTE